MLQKRYILLLPLKSIISVIAIEKINSGINKGKVKTLAIENLLFFEIVREAVIEEIKTILRRDSDNNALICNK